jgi:hypothetical protein
MQCLKGIKINVSGSQVYYTLLLKDDANVEAIDNTYEGLKRTFCGRNERKILVEAIDNT